MTSRLNSKTAFHTDLIL